MNSRPFAHASPLFCLLSLLLLVGPLRAYAETDLIEMAESNRKFTGSFNFFISPRFFSDASLGSQNGFRKWGIPEIGATFGLFELPYGFEPMLGFSYVQNTSKTLASAGAYSSKYTYRYFTTLAGLRYRAWPSTFFIVSPIVEVAMTFRYGSLKRETQDPSVKHSNVGHDFGGAFTVGSFISLFYNEERKSDLYESYAVKDFGLEPRLSYFPAGLGRKGLGGVKTTGGWSFGMALAVDW